MQLIKKVVTDSRILRPVADPLQGPGFFLADEDVCRAQLMDD